MTNAPITGRDIDYVDRLREIVASAHAIRCTCTPLQPDARCRELQSLAAGVPGDTREPDPIDAPEPPGGDLELVSEFEVMVGEASGKIEQMQAANHIIWWWASVRSRLRPGDRILIVRGEL